MNLTNLTCASSFTSKTFFKKLCDYNLFINMTYVDKGEEPKRKWRGVYWDGVPDKNDVYEDDVEEEND